MGSSTFFRVSCALFTAICWSATFAQPLKLGNSSVIAEFDGHGLKSVENPSLRDGIKLAKDGWSITIDDRTFRSDDAAPTVRQVSKAEILYQYQWPGYEIDAIYRLQPGWEFVAKQIAVVQTPSARFTVHRVVPWDIEATEPLVSYFVPSTYTPQFGHTIEQSRASLPGKDFGIFLRLPDARGAMLNVQNPYLQVQRSGQSVTIAYAPEMTWDQSWGQFQSDIGCLAQYHLTGRRYPREMVKEWQPAPHQMPADGMDEAEVAAYTASVRAFLIDPAPSPISVEVGWTLNDYQIDVGTEEGRAEYKRIIHTASELEIHTLLFAPENSQVSDRLKSADTWSWEYVLWLGLGEKIRKGEWDPAKDAIPASIAAMLQCAKQEHVGLLAYVYPSIPFGKNPAWLVRRENDRETVPETGSSPVYATLASRTFQDYLIRMLIAFQKRTGIAGYSFDYTWLNLPGSSSYAQWFGWRRVMDAVRKADPAIVIDGRQSYQLYGPWSWLAGSYPHPTGNDEQPESFKPFPDLHFDRVSADRLRFVNYWYRNYQFAPEQIIPGYATHQTERSRNVTNANGQREVEMMYTRYRPRDWDYLGFRYSFLSSIATGGWNNVVDMIPARDEEESRHFSAEDKKWIRDWLEWTATNKQYLLHTRNILEQPALGHVDGTSAILGNRGFLFLFNPNYKQMPARFVLDSSIGLDSGTHFLLREIYPQKGRILGKPGRGVWTRGDTVELPLDGTSATVFELEPFTPLHQPLLLNGTTAPSAGQDVSVNGARLTIAGLAGEPGTTQKIGVLLPNKVQIATAEVNGQSASFRQSGNHVEIPINFAGVRFAQAQQIQVKETVNGEFSGSFVVPQRVLEQLAERKKAWPIPWTPADYESTWLAPERLLLFVQLANPSDSMTVSASLDGKPLKLTPAYSSSRVDRPCFVGFYADLSQITPDVPHKIELKAPELASGQLQGIFFDNVLPQLTQSLKPSK